MILLLDSSAFTVGLREPPNTHLGLIIVGCSMGEQVDARCQTQQNLKNALEPDVIQYVDVVVLLSDVHLIFHIHFQTRQQTHDHFGKYAMKKHVIVY